MMPSQGKESQTHQTESRVRPRAIPDELRIHKNLLLIRGIRLPVHILATKVTELRRVQLCMRKNEEELTTTANVDQGSRSRKQTQKHSVKVQYRLLMERNAKYHSTKHASQVSNRRALSSKGTVKKPADKWTSNLSHCYSICLFLSSFTPHTT